MLPVFSYYDNHISIYLQNPTLGFNIYYEPTHLSYTQSHKEYHLAFYNRLLPMTYSSYIGHIPVFQKFNKDK